MWYSTLTFWYKHKQQQLAGRHWLFPLFHLSSNATCDMRLTVRTLDLNSWYQHREQSWRCPHWFSLSLSIPLSPSPSNIPASAPNRLSLRNQLMCVKKKKCFLNGMFSVLICSEQRCVQNNLHSCSFIDSSIHTVKMQMLCMSTFKMSSGMCYQLLNSSHENNYHPEHNLHAKQTSSIIRVIFIDRKCENREWIQNKVLWSFVYIGQCQ